MQHTRSRSSSRLEVIAGEHPHLSREDWDYLVHDVAPEIALSLHSEFGRTLAGDEVEDSIADALTQLVERPGLYDPDRGRLDSYLYVVARSRLLDALRSRARSRALTASDLRTLIASSLRQSIPQTDDGARRLALLRAAIDKLPPIQRLATLDYLDAPDEYGWATEHARRYGIDPNTARVRLHRARQALKRALATGDSLGVNSPVSGESQSPEGLPMHVDTENTLTPDKLEMLLKYLSETPTEALPTDGAEATDKALLDRLRRLAVHQDAWLRAARRRLAPYRKMVDTFVAACLKHEDTGPLLRQLAETEDDDDWSLKKRVDRSLVALEHTLRSRMPLSDIRAGKAMFKAKRHGDTVTGRWISEEGASAIDLHSAILAALESAGGVDVAELRECLGGCVLEALWQGDLGMPGMGLIDAERRFTWSAQETAVTPSTSDVEASEASVGEAVSASGLPPTEALRDFASDPSGYRRRTTLRLTSEIAARLADALAYTS